MTAADPAALIARAKRAAVPVMSCVAASLPPAHIIGGMSRAELAALVIVLAEAADPHKLRAVVEAADDGTPGVTDLDLVYRRAHREAARLRGAGEPVPLRIRVLDGKYHEARKEARAGAAGRPASRAPGVTRLAASARSA